jgi:hypothetical protein
MKNSIYAGNLMGSELLKELRGESVVIKDVTANEVTGTNISGQDSFRYDPLGTGLKSTQQIPIDWSQFENHTFFNSAQAKTNVAFESIINGFPFDGNDLEIEKFLDSLTGFEKYIFDSFPKYTGYLNFDQSNYIEVNDRAGFTIPEISRNKSGDSVLDPGLNSMTIEMQVFVPQIATSDCIITQKLNTSNVNGFTLATVASASTTNCDVKFIISSGTNYSTAISSPIEKGRFVPVAVVFSREPDDKNVHLYIDGQLTASVSQPNLGRLNFSSDQLKIANGSNHITTDYTFVPTNQFLGSIDDIKIYHRVRTQYEISSSINNTTFPDPDLKLYFKFNEPTGSYTNNSLVLDHSGNGLHSQVTAFNQSQRVKHVDSPITNEIIEYSPVLFSDHPDIVSLNEQFLESALEFDRNNPNLITKLIPQHYLLQEQDFYSLDSIEGDVGQPIDAQGTRPGDTKIGSVQIISAILYTWAKQFDEVKMFIDHYSSLNQLGYNEIDTVSSQLLPFLAQKYGISLPNFFRDIGIKGNQQNQDSLRDSKQQLLSFSEIQNTIWRRILHEIPTLTRAKGTIGAVKSLIRLAGIEPDSNIRFKEYGGQRTSYLSGGRVPRSIVQGFLNFSGSLNKTPASFNSIGIPTNFPFVSGTFLSGSRTEPGDPIVSNTANDGLFTSGSWSYEAIYKFDPSYDHPILQSLARINVTGSSFSTSHGVLANLVAIAGNGESSLSLFVSSSLTGSNLLNLGIDGINIFDGNAWHISFGRSGSLNEASSSYFIWAASDDSNTVKSAYQTSYYFDNGSYFSKIDSSLNSSGSFICIGLQSLDTIPYYINGSTDSLAKTTMFSGKVGRIRFWSKQLSQDELLEHAQNIESVGVETPSLNYNFVNELSGSWERLRVDCWLSQPTTSSASTGGIQLFDYSQNQYHMTGSGFDSSAQVINSERMKTSVMSMKFDEAVEDNKFRIRGLSDPSLHPEIDAEVGPVFSVRKSEEPIDDLRFSMEVSPTRVLDEDIAKIFATLDELDDAVGAIELQFSPDYPKLEAIRDVYFNRLTDKINLKLLFEFFKWFDKSMGALIERFIPSNTIFLGSNYVIEPHSLERSKFSYLQSEIYVENRLKNTEVTVVEATVGI